MLVKLAGDVHASKLRAILPLEEDFNALNKTFEVIGGRRCQSSTHVALNKKLVYDIGSQHKKPAVVVSADTSNFYDRIAHPISSMAYQHFGLQL